MSFNVGDRARVNQEFDPLVPDELRDQMIGKAGAVSEVVNEEFGMLFFSPDEIVRDYPGQGAWAVLASELDKLEV